MNEKMTGLALLDLNETNYACPKGEEHLYHYRLELVNFSSTTGERLSRPFIQKSGIKFFEEGGLHSLRGLGYTIEVLHNPRKWMQVHAKEIAAQQAKQKEEELKAQAEAKEAEKKALYEEFKKQLEADGLEIVKSKNK